MHSIGIGLAGALICIAASGQPPNSSTQTATSSDEAGAPVKVYSLGSGVTPPEQIRSNLSMNPQGSCNRLVDGAVKLSLLVDKAGRPRNIMFIRPLGTDLDELALQIVEADQFKPGTFAGAPVVVSQSVDVRMQVCVEESVNGAGEKTYTLRMHSVPVQNFGPLEHSPKLAILSPGPVQGENASSADSGIGGRAVTTTPPVPLNTVTAEYTPAAPNRKISGYCVVSMIVDSQGMPHMPRLRKSLDPGLDQSAIRAVKRYRFIPAMRNGEPVSAMISVEVKFGVR